MKKYYITEISERDFRKLDLYDEKGKSLNEDLDHNIEGILKCGSEEDLEWLSEPVTVAIHNEGGFYLDKFMDRFSGPTTYEMAFGIPHIYITRDYYEAHNDYWRVRKDETKAIYRVHLDEKWVDMFVLKKKNVILENIGGDKHYIEGHYELNEKTGEWELKYKTEVIKEGQRTTYKKVE